MSERQPNPEKKKKNPLTDNCDTCSKDYEITQDNGALYYYPGQKECSNLMCRCPHCQAVIRIFIGMDAVQQAIANGLKPINSESNAPDDIYKRWLRLHDVELVPSYELTNRHEAIIQKFGETILAMPDDLLNEGFHDEQNKPYPQKWI